MSQLHVCATVSLPLRSDEAAQAEDDQEPAAVEHRVDQRVGGTLARGRSTTAARGYPRNYGCASAPKDAPPLSVASWCFPELSTATVPTPLSNASWLLVQ